MSGVISKWFHDYEDNLSVQWPPQSAHQSPLENLWEVHRRFVAQMHDSQIYTNYLMLIWTKISNT